MKAIQPGEFSPSSRAQVSLVLETTGARLWSDVAVADYKHAQAWKLSRPLSVRARDSLFVMTELMCCAVTVSSLWAHAFYWAFAVVAFAAYFAVCCLLVPEVQWHTNDADKWPGTHMYYRDGVVCRVPDAIEAIIARTETLYPLTGFAVSFIGLDPILHATIHGHVYHLAVWDENPDGSITILNPTSV